MIRLDHVSKTFPGSSKPAVGDLSLEVPEGEIAVFIGPSGCGKSTTLRMINRLIEPTSGTITVGGRDVMELKPHDLRLGIGYVIQQVGLFPHMTVAENISVTPRLLGWEKDHIRARVDDLLELVHLTPAEYRDRRPRQLSGGQQQRVGLARALAADPEVLLMDEPFGALDAITRASMQEELLHVHRRFRKTTIFVTHDVDEALRLADLMVVMHEGRMVQAGSPRELLMNPAGDFVRALLGTDDRIRALGLITAGEMMVAGDLQGRQGSSRAVSTETSLRDALSMLLEPGVDVLIVERGGQPVGYVGWEQIRGAGHGG